MKYCTQCGASAQDAAKFCIKCGATFGVEPEAPPQTQPAQTYTPPQQPGSAYAAPQPQRYNAPQQAEPYTMPTNAALAGLAYAPPLAPSAPKKKKHVLRWVLILLGVALLAVVIINVIGVIQLRAKKASTTPLPAASASALAVSSPSSSAAPAAVSLADEPLADNARDALMLSYLKDVVPFSASYEADEVIFPAMYRSRQSLVSINAAAPTATKALLTVEIPGFTHKYEKQINLSPIGINMQVLPAMLDGALEKCNTSKKAQLQVSLVTESGQELLHDTKEITLQSMYDMQFFSADGTVDYSRNICAWITPEEPLIRTLQRDATDTLDYLSDGAYKQFVGYQGTEDDTLNQLIALYATLAKVYEVRYNMTPVTTSGNGAHQRIALPKNVIEDRSGLCVETAVTMASAAEALGFNTYILFPPGHSMTLVELQDGSCNYVLIETTALTYTSYDEVFVTGSAADMAAYLRDTMQIDSLISVKSERRNGIHPMK